jgi:hypothetical protein
VAEITCSIPVRVRVIGVPSDEQLERLSAAVEGAVARRIAFAERAVRAGAGDQQPTATAATRDPYDPGRELPDPLAYAVPSYQQAGKPAGVPLKQAPAASAPAGGTLLRVDLYLAERLLVAVLDGGSPLFFEITEPPRVTPGQAFTWTYRDGAHRLSLGAQGEVIVKFRGRVKDLDAFAHLAGRAREPVPAFVHASASQPPAPGEKGAEEGERTEPLVGDEGVFVGNATLAGLYLDFLARYAGMKVDRKQAANGLTAEQVRAITRDNERAQTVTRYFTQGWKEFQAAGAGNDLGQFAVLEETVLTQWDRGNYTAQHNLLELRKDREGLGLYRRRTPFRYYDESGEPVPAIGGGFRDSGYRAAAPPSFALNLEISDPGLLQVLQAIRHVTVEEQILIYKAAKGYADNRDLLWPAVRSGWDGWTAVNQELQRQFPILVGFLAGELVAIVLQRSSDPRAKAVGLVLEAILKRVGRVFNIVFAGEAAWRAYKCGRELSLIRREEGQPLDALSQRHLEAAAEHMRQLLTMIVSAALLAAIVKTLESTAKSVKVGEPPQGGGGLELATADAGAGRGGTGAAARGAGAAGTASGGPRPLGVPVPPWQLREGDEAGGGGEPAEGGREQGRPETGREKERRELRQDRPSRPARSAEYFDYEGGDRGSFRDFVRNLRAHVERLVGAGERDPVPGLKGADPVLDQDAEGFIRSRGVLNEIWDGWSQRLARQLLSLDAEIRASRGDQARVSDLRRRYKQVEEAKAELDEFAQGKVGDKRPDLVELFFRNQRGEVTDITQRPGDPVHNFKTLFYAEVVEALLGWTNVTGREYSSPTNQRVLTPSEVAGAAGAPGTQRR